VDGLNHLSVLNWWRSRLLNYVESSSPYSPTKRVLSQTIHFLRANVVGIPDWRCPPRKLTLPFTIGIHNWITTSSRLSNYDSQQVGYRYQFLTLHSFLEEAVLLFVVSEVGMSRETQTVLASLICLRYVPELLLLLRGRVSFTALASRGLHLDGVWIHPFNHKISH